MDQASPILHKHSRNSFTMNIMGLTFYGKFRREKFVKLSSASDTATNLRFIIDSIYLPVCLSILDFLHFKWLSFFIWIAYLVWNLDYDSWGAWVSGHHVPGGRFTCSFLFIFGQGKAPSGSPGFHTFPPGQWQPYSLMMIGQSQWFLLCPLLSLPKENKFDRHQSYFITKWDVCCTLWKKICPFKRPRPLTLQNSKM